MSRNLKLYFEDILNSIGKRERYVRDLNYQQFIADEKTFDAVAYNLQIIGEAIKNVPPEIRKNYPQLEWRKIAGLRDIIAHSYFNIDEVIIWDIIANKLPNLKNQIEQILLDIDNENEIFQGF
jgi:uncharacterized protein with HEPN domain